MDRRRFAREPTNLEVYARAAQHGAQRLRVRDISSNGVFLRGWPTPAPRPGTEVSLTFLIGGGSIVKLFRRAARVARVTDEGVALVHGAKALTCEAARPRARSPWSSLRWPEVD